MQTADSGVLKYLGDMLKKDPSLRCPRHAIKLQAQTLNVNAMEGDYRNTGQCNLDVTREKYLPQFVGYALQKNSPYARQIDQGYAPEQCLQQK